MNVQQRCQCGFTHDQITSSVFRCFSDSPHAVTYRAVLHGTVNASSSDIISHMEQWIFEGAAISVQNVLIDVDTSCVLEIASNLDNECDTVITDASTQLLTVVPMITKKSSNAVSGIVGGVVSIVFIIIALMAIVGAIALLLKWRKKRRIETSHLR